MIPWQLLDSAPVPGGAETLRLYRRGAEFSIRVDGDELMNSRVHGSEDALAELACARLAGLPSPRVLIGGLGMGYTAAAALSRLNAQAEVVVAELLPAVVAWNRGVLAGLAGNPLDDGRVSLRVIDVAEILKTEQQGYDAILLDVDNGPEGLTRSGNDWLYTRGGLIAARAALKPSGILAIWSATSDPAFSKLLRQAGFTVEEVAVRARGRKGGSRHMIWLAQRE
ncbi:MAG: spermidine synthase [Desulfobulbia bacterium]